MLEVLGVFNRFDDIGYDQDGLQLQADMFERHAATHNSSYSSRSRPRWTHSRTGHCLVLTGTQQHFDLCHFDGQESPAKINHGLHVLQLYSLRRAAWSGTVSASMLAAAVLPLFYNVCCGMYLCSIVLMCDSGGSELQVHGEPTLLTCSP